MYVAFLVCYHRPFYRLLMASYRSVTTCKRSGMAASTHREPA